MDTRLKRLLVDAIIPTSMPMGVRDVLSQVDDNVFLHIAGLVDVPCEGEAWRVNRNGVLYDGTVSAVNYLEGYFTVTYEEPETLYFSTTEQAKVYATCGNKGGYNGWSRNMDDEHQHPAEYDVEKKAHIYFNEL